MVLGPERNDVVTAWDFKGLGARNLAGRQVGWWLWCSCPWKWSLSKNI